MPPKRRRRFQGLYYHSSPPKVMPMNGQPLNQGRKRRDVDDFAVKLSTIRIWMHEKDIGKLTRILWTGQGNRLCQQASTNPRVKRFLAAVPHVMNSIKEVHQAVIDNNLETLQAKLEPPVPPALITCKDVNGLNLIHKAAGLGHTKILEYLIGVWPDGAHETDITGKTALHWAASAKNNMRCYTLLTQAGCDEEAVDYKMKTPSYYRHKSHDIERAFLVYVPEAPRVSPDVATDWEALSEDNGEGKKLDIKIPEMNGINGRAHTDDSIENTSEVDMNDGVSAVEEDTLRKSASTENGNESAPATPAHDDEQADVVLETQPDHNGNDNANEIDADDEETNTKTLNETATTPIATDDEKDDASDNASAQEDEEHANGNEAEEEVEVTKEGGDEDEMNGNENGKAIEVTNDSADEELETGAVQDEDKEDDKVQKEEDKESEEETDKDEDREKDENKNEDEEETAQTAGVVEKDDEKGKDDIENEVDKDMEKDAENEVEANVGKEDESQNVQEDTSEDFEENEVEEDNEEQEKDDQEERENTKKDEEMEMEAKQVDNDVSTSDKEDTDTDNAEEEAETPTESGENKRMQVDGYKSPEKSIKAETDIHANVDQNENLIKSQTTETNQKQEVAIEAEAANAADEMSEFGPAARHGTDTHNETDKTEADVNNDEGSDAKSSSDETEDEALDAPSESAAAVRQSAKLNKIIKQDQETSEETRLAKTVDGSGDGIDKKPGSGIKRGLRSARAASAAATDHDDDDDETNDSVADDEPAEPEPETAAEDDPRETAEVDALDDNHNEGEGSSPTSSLAIEGFVAGASEDNRVQSQSAAYVDEDARIKDIIAAGDMEQLAQIVLNGDGKKLLNMESSEPEIQAFLNNVPNYMGKIRCVHEAAREGSLLSLQQALDRRKFAIAKDDISPNGATPLHVAVVFGNSDIVRYLAARFPETTTITDNDGRTALHYAATIKDNGHFYNVLTQLGANAKALDKLGHTPEFYQDTEESKDILSYQKLLSDFGAEELEDELLNDQVPDDLHSSRRRLQDGDIEHTLDRCFSVIEESSKVLSGATASALAHRKPLSASTLQLSVTSYLSRFLKRKVFLRIRHRQTRLDHNLFDVIWPAMRKTSKLRHLEEDINCGIVAPDFDVFVVFQEFLVPLIKDMHCMSITDDFQPHPRIAFFPMENGDRLNTAGFVFDDDSSLIQCCTVECSRNLEEYELPLNLTVGQVEQAERMMMGKIFTNAFAEAIGETESGSYYTLTEIIEDNSEVYEMLTKLGLMIPLLDAKDAVQAAESVAFNGNLWPYGRGVYLNSDNNLALWLNCQEHLRVIATTSAKDAPNMGAAYTRVGRAVCFLETQLHFKESYLLGYLQARPSYLGTGLKFSTSLKLPNLMKEVDNLRHLCSVRGLSLITNPTSKMTVRLVNMQSLGAIEYVLFQDYCTAVTNIMSLEKDMSLTNSKHIASMLVKIFRRQAESHSCQSNPIFKTEQGKYLANNLADPLIKALTEIANKRPDDPVAFLTGYLQSYLRARNPNGAAAAEVNGKTSFKRDKNAALSNGYGGDEEDRIEEDRLSTAGEEETFANLDDRDEHGQSMLHFACARSHRRGALMHLIEESHIDITYRDELYRTARDVSLQANQPGNAKDIDRYVLSLAVVGDLRTFDRLAISGYDHIIDVADENGTKVTEIAMERGHTELVEFLQNLRSLEEQREELHQLIRDNNVPQIKEMVAEINGGWLIKAKNYYGRTALHIAILKESQELVEHFVNLFPDALKIGDNLERTALHYAMGTNAIESLSRILIQKGAKRTIKDLKGRQPSYYFMNKADILRLQEEEDENR